MTLVKWSPELPNDAVSKLRVEAAIWKQQTVLCSNVDRYIINIFKRTT